MVSEAYGNELISLSDVDHAGCHDTRKSTLVGIKLLGENLVSWSSKKQNCTTKSAAKVEYVSFFGYYAQVLWMRTQPMDYGFFFDKIPMNCDLKSAIAKSCYPVQHSWKNHIEFWYHFIEKTCWERHD